MKKEIYGYEEFLFDRETNQLRVVVRSADPVIKGVRAKAQKYLKSKGVFDAMVFFDGIERLADKQGHIISLCSLHIYSPTLTLKTLTRSVKL